MGSGGLRSYNFKFGGGEGLIEKIPFEPRLTKRE